MKMIVFWDSAPCSLVAIDLYFRDADCLYHQGNYAVGTTFRKTVIFILARTLGPEISLDTENVGFEVLTAVSTKLALFRVVAPCSLVVYQTTRRYNAEDSHLNKEDVFHRFMWNSSNFVPPLQL
jgi:hypothetical protein